MSFSFGKVMKYNHGAEWEAYTEQLAFYFLANGVTDDQTKKAILFVECVHGDISAAQRLVGTSHTERRRGNVFGDSGPVAKTHKSRKNQHWLLDTSLTIDRDMLVNLSAIPSQR